jgi:hypothetical protein
MHSDLSGPSVRDLAVLTPLNPGARPHRDSDWGEELRFRRRSAETRSEPLLSQEVMNTIHEL